MSRIYQGGQSEASYSGTSRNAGFNPNRVVGKKRAIQEEGALAQQDLKTKDRERRRDEEMESVSRRAQDQVDRTELQIAQQQVTDQLKLEQTLDKSELANAQLLAKNSLDGKISKDRAKQTYTQTLESNVLKLQDLEEKTGLGMEARALSANQALQRQELQAQQSVQNSNRAVGQSIIQGLVDFGVAGIKQVAANNEQIRKEEQQLADIGFNSLIGSDVGGTADAIAEQNNILASETAEEQAIQQIAPNAPLQQEAIRGPSADIAMSRNIEQRDIGMASMTFQGDLMSIISDPNTKVMTPTGMKSFGEITDASEYQNGVIQVARQISKEYGISGKNAFAAKMAYARAAKDSISRASFQGATDIMARNKANRYGAALDNAAVMGQNEDLQGAWNVVRAAAVAKYPGKSMREINDLAFKDLQGSLPDYLQSKLGDVLKDPNNPGSAFGKEYRYAEMIRDEVYSRGKEVQNENNLISAENAYEVKQLSQDTAVALYSVQTPEESEQIRQQAISQLEALGTPEAIDEIAKLRGKSGNLSRNNNVYLGLVEAFDNGEPPSTSDIEEALASKAISFDQAKALKERGKTADQLKSTLKEAGLGNGLKEFNSIVATSITSNSGDSIDITEARNQSGGIAKQLNDRYEYRLNQYIRSQGDNLTMPGLRQEADKIKADLTAELMGPNKTKANDGDLMVEDGVVTYKGWGRVPPARQTYNPLTREPQGNYTGFTVSQLPTSASASDRLLSRKQFVDNIAVLESGSTDFGPRLQEMAKKFDTSPVRFLESQSKALGYSDSRLGTISPGLIEQFEPTSMESGKNALKALGFSDVGSAYLSGNIMTESSWLTGVKPHDDGGAPAGGLVSWRADRLDKIQKYLRKDIEQASPSEQLDAMKWEMKKDYPSSYRIFTNPNATKAQLRRESYRYWGWGEEGKRFALAESLITSGTHTSGSGGAGELGPTGALTYKGNKASYVETASLFEDIGFKIGEHSAFGGTAPVHAGNSYHNHDEAFDITHWNGTRSHSIAETGRLKNTIRSMNLFKEVIGPGDGDPNHETHLHVGGLLRQPTAAEKVRLRALFK